MIVVGLLVLPVGSMTRLKRRRPLVVACRTCGTESRKASRPFGATRHPGDRLGYVTYTACNRNFTVDGSRPLV
jgi:hypothetical protein